MIDNSTKRVAKHDAGRRKLYVRLGKDAEKALERGKRIHKTDVAAVSHALESTYPQTNKGRVK